ncbi:ParB/RepB/Spo0J family partition protein [Verrucomicrobiales bacterium]|nr:ParB/RepB/Spo0J family partition protein [Verrucomicrobiales bacterium]
MFPSALSPHPARPSVNPDRSTSDWQDFIDDIEDNGITEPILFVDGQEGRRLIVDGVRRWNAAKEIPLTDVPANRLFQEEAAMILAEKAH